MDVVRIATDPPSRRLSFTERHTSADDRIARIGALLAAGEGYCEVRVRYAIAPGPVRQYCLLFHHCRAQLAVFTGQAGRAR